MPTYMGKVGWCIAYAVIALVVFVGNALSIGVFLMNHRLRRIRASILIINLSVADLIVGAVTLPMYITLQLGGQHVTTEAFRAAFDSVDLLSGLGSIFSLVVIALERTYSVYWPHRHRAAKTKIYILSISLVWVVALVLMLLRLLRKFLSFKAFFFAMVICLSTSLVILTFAYLFTWYRIKSSNTVVHSNRQAREQTQNRKLAATLAIVTGVFIVTWLPFHIVNIIFFACGSHCSFVISLQSVYTIKFLHYVNSLLNPVIYTLQLPEFRKTFWKLIGRSNVVYPEPTSINTISPRVPRNSAMGVRVANSQY